MKELLEKLKAELEKINTNAKVNEAQTAAIKELTDYVNLLIDETSANNKTDKAQDEVDELLFQQIYELIQKTDALAKEGVKLSKVQNLENKLDKELQAVKAAGVKDYSEVKDKIADLKEKDIKTDASIKKVKDELNEAKVESVKVDQAQNKEIAENEEDIAALKKELKEMKELVNPIYNEYVSHKNKMIEKSSISGTLKTLCIKLFKEFVRFSIYFVVYIIITSL
jgi:type VI protein secretion system component VasK